MGFLTRLLAGLLAASTLGTGLAGTANAVDAAGAASDTTGAVTTTADDTGGRTVLDCRQSGEGATGPYADKFCWIDWSNLPLDSSGKPTPVRINVPGGHIDADATITHTDNAALTAKDYTGSKWSRLTSAYKLTGNTALAFSGRMGRQDPAASVTFSNVTPSADRTDTGVNVLKDFQLAFGDAEVMSGGVLQGHDVYERTDIESDKTLEKLGMIGSGDPNQSYSKANTGYGTTHVTLAGGPKGATDDANKDSKGAAVVGAKQASRFKVSFGQVNQHWDGWGSAIAVGVYMPYLTAYPLTYDKNASDAAGEVPSNQRGKENTTQPAKTKTSGTVRTAADTDAADGSQQTETQSSTDQGRAASTASNLPDHLVNGDFNVNYKDQWLTGGWNWTSITPDGKYLNSVRNWNDSATTWKTVNGWDKTKFGWSSTQKDGTDNIQHKAGAVEIQYDDLADNVYAELCAYEAGTAIYQDIKTVPGTLYKVRLKHASLYDGYLDKMQVMIGAPGHEQAVEMTRTGVNGNGDKLNEKSNIIATKVSNTGENDRNHDSQWESYEGTYVIPEGQTVTRFTFRSVGSRNLDHGNLLDDIVFDKAYRLDYDKNSNEAAGSVPSNQRGKENTVKPAATKTSGTVRTVADTNSSLPDHLVNGDFEYPGVNVLSKNRYDEKDNNWWGVSRKDRMVYDPSHEIQWVSLPSTFDSDRFAWDSTEVAGTQNGSSQWHTNEVELQRDSHTGNMYGELCAFQAHTSIRQYIRTTPGTLYKVRLKHASLSRDYLDKMQVLVGPAGNEQPVSMTRVESQNGLDATGKATASTTVSTHASNEMEIKDGQGTLYSSRNHDGQWATYEGIYVATSDVTSFTFKSVDAKAFNLGNLLDDIVFDKAYKLTYDANSSDASGQVPSDTAANTVKQAKTRTTGTVRAVADRTASGLTVHDLETDDVPGDYRQFVLNTTDTRLSQVEFENGAWYKSTDSSSQGMWPLKLGASLTIPSVGEWTDPSGRTHQISMTMRLKDWNGGSVSELYRFDGHGNIVGDGRFWINTAYGSGYSSLPAKVEQAMGKVDTSKRVGCSWTVEFTYADTGEKVPDTFKGVTGFNDLDGWDAQSDLKFEGVQLLDGFDGAYKRSDAELGTYGTNGFAGIGHDAGDEAHLNAPQQSRHRLAATWTGSTFTFSYDLGNPAGRTDGSRMTFGAPVTRTAVLTYDKNAADASGQVPSNTTPDTTQTASSTSTGKVSDLVQRTTTHEDGSVTVKTIDTSTDVVSGCQVYYPAGQRITLATMAKDDDCWDSSMLSRPGHTQLGWNQDRNATQAQAQVTMVEGGMTVYAVWVGNPVLTYDTNKPSTWSGQMPSTPASVSVAYNTAAADGSGWAAGDTSKIRGYRFLGWYTGPQDNAGLYDWTRPLTGSVTVYAHWQRLQANVIYNANGGTGSHANTTGWQYSDVTIPGDTSKSFKRDKYVFKGWGTKPGKADVVYKDGSKVALQDKDITLYAQWQEVHENFVETGGIGLPIAIAGGVLLLMFGIGSTVMLTRRMNGHGMPDDE